MATEPVPQGATQVFFPRVSFERVCDMPCAGPHTPPTVLQQQTSELAIHDDDDADDILRSIMMDVHWSL